MTISYSNVNLHITIVCYQTFIRLRKQILKTISQKQIWDIIKNLNVNKAHGPDDISGRMIELCGENIALPLSIILNNVIKTEFSQIYGKVLMLPLFVIKNYRPISLLPLFAKIFERNLFLNMHNLQWNYYKKSVCVPA